MSKSTWALIIIVVGVVANNYIYLHDAVWSRNPALTAAANDLFPGAFGSLIFVGWLGYLGIVVTLAVILVGLVLAMRETEAS